ncbi:MAG: EAL domain-containing protein [Clostridia bacterium]|nr:EAL domain-containing protein [Clostridia bacterium]
MPPTELCGKYGVPTARLRVEITETALIEDVQRQNEMVEHLHRAGFLVEIDDFGKGYSSLSLLKDIHADVLKIDMGFLQSTENRQRSRVILNSVIGMANELNMGVITEGVETLEQAESLTAMGCHNFQGFFYSRPVPVKDFEALALENVQMGFGTRRTSRQNPTSSADGISKQ